MEARTQRIVETAIKLAERDGFDAVRLRDVASMSNVALGTVYRRFRSKEDILVAALEHEVDKLETLPLEMLPGDSAAERTIAAFEIMTRWLCGKPNFARACLRSVTSGVPEITDRVTRFHDKTTGAIVRVMQSGTSTDFDVTHLQFLAKILQNLWFAEVVGWAGGLHDEEVVITRMRKVVRFLMATPAA